MTMMRVLLCGAAFCAAGAADAALTHSYDFDNGLSDSVVGGVALTPSVRGTASGSAAGGFYSFDRGAGLMLGSQLPGDIYTIEMSVALTDTGGYRKLISFGSLGPDTGLYDLNGSLNLYNVRTSSTPDFTPGALTNLRLSRDGAGLVTGYVSGTQVFSYDDSVSRTYTANTALYFLRDDTAQNGEDSAGRADYIRIYDTAVPTVTPPPVTGSVPEPAAWATMIAGFGMIGAALRKTRRVGVAFARA